MLRGSVTKVVVAFQTLSVACMMLGCKAAPVAQTAHLAVPAYPQRPTVAPPLFKLFHQTDDSLTLVAKENATDDEIEAIIWQLRDAAHAHSFAEIHLPQKFIDKRAPIVFMHIYRGTKCASEKYGSGTLPCGHSYHAAGEFTYGGFANHNRDDGALLKDEDHQVELWNPDQAVSH